MRCATRLDELLARVVIWGMAKLTEKQEKFAFYIGADGLKQNAAYRKAFNAEKMSDRAVDVHASKLAKRADVALRIDALRSARVATVEQDMKFDVRKLFETYLAISFADPNELIGLKVGACRYCHGEGHAYHWREREYLDALAKWERKPEGPMPDIAGGFGYKHFVDPHPDCPECGGDGLERVVPRDSGKLSPGARLLYRGAQQTKDGIKVLIADKDKALENIGRILGAFDDKLRVDLEGKVAALKLTTSDPAAAAEAYAKMIKGS